MKKKLMLYLLLIIVASSAATAAIIGGYARNRINTILENQKKDLLAQIKGNFIIFDQFLLDIEKKMNRDSEDALQHISDELKSKKKRRDISPRELKALAAKYQITDIYIINKDGVVFNTSFPPDMNFNLFSIGEDFTNFLKSIYGKGEIFHQRMAQSNKTGIVNMYMYYSPKGEDYIVEISVKVRDYIISNFSPEYYELLFQDLFTNAVKYNRYLKTIDIYRITDVAGWSFINEGKRFNKDKEVIRQIKAGKDVRIKSGDLVTTYYMIKLDQMNFDFVKELYVEVKYDFSILNRFIKNSVLYALLTGLGIAIVVFVLSSRLFDRYLVKRIVDINTGLKKIEEGNYDSCLAVKGDDELSRIAANVNKMREEIKAREAALRESEENFRTIFDNAKDAIFIETKRGEILDVNRAVCDLLGYTKEELCGMRVGDLVPPEVAERLPDTIQEKTVKPSKYIETYDVRKDGTRVPIEVSNTLVEIGGEERVIAIVRDITERKRMELQFLHAQKLEALGILAGGLAHDFNNLLVGMLGNTALARQKLSSTQPVQPLLAEVQKAAERAANLTRQMLAYSGKGRFQIELMDLSDQVREISGLVKSSLPATTQLRFELAGDLPGIKADVTQIQQLVMNLILNSFEAVEEETAVITIVTGVEEVAREGLKTFTVASDNMEPGIYVSLQVQDSGKGMDKETIAKIFDPFFTSKATGRGLGLSAVLGIVRGHRGGIRVYSSPGKGTTVKVLFPVSGERPAPKPVQEEPLERQTGVILVVDDEEMVRRVAKRALEHYGYTVLSAVDGRDCLQQLERNAGKISAILLDLIMPVISGVETYRRIRMIYPEMPVLLSSGYDEAESTRRFAGKGLTGFIQKPYTPKALAEKIGECLLKPGDRQNERER